MEVVTFVTCARQRAYSICGKGTDRAATLTAELLTLFSLFLTREANRFGLFPDTARRVTPLATWATVSSTASS